MMLARAHPSLQKQYYFVYYMMHCDVRLTGRVVSGQEGNGACLSSLEALQTNHHTLPTCSISQAAENNSA